VWVVGLGNPGARYEGTRHNAGFEVLYRLVARWKARLALRESEVEAFRSGDVTLVAPLAFMNRSGDALAAYEESSGTRLVPAETLVVCDDIYLPVGTLRLRPGGSTAGHRGLESIEAHFGTPEYPRLRIGVGGQPGEGLADHVLSRFEPAERDLMDEAVAEAEQAVETWASEGILAAMNRFNRRSRGVSS